MPKISIIIPCYKVEKYLKQCIDSILAQTFSDWEAICIDDGSPDNSGNILDKYAKLDPRFKVIHQPNQGLSMARNNGKKIATGKYIYFLDSDDSIHPQLLEITYNLAQKYNADLVCFETHKGNKEKFEITEINPSKIKTKITNNPLNFIRKSKKYKIHYNVWTKLYKKELLEGIDFIPQIHFEDYPHTYAILARTPLTVITPTKMHFYTDNGESISNKKSNPKQINDYHIGLKSIYEIYSKPSLKKELAILKHSLIPNILKQQLNRCNDADSSNKPLMFAEFTKELIDLNNKNLLSWRGHKLTKYLTYKKLIRENSI